jgi:hypothetical protein
MHTTTVHDEPRHTKTIAPRPPQRRILDGPLAMIPAVLITALALGTLLRGVPGHEDARSASQQPTSAAELHGNH